MLSIVPFLLYMAEEAMNIKKQKILEKDFLQYFLYNDKNRQLLHVIIQAREYIDILTGIVTVGACHADV